MAPWTFPPCRHKIKNVNDFGQWVSAILASWNSCPMSPPPPPLRKIGTRLPFGSSKLNKPHKWINVSNVSKAFLTQAFHIKQILRMPINYWNSGELGVLSFILVRYSWNWRTFTSDWTCCEMIKSPGYVRTVPFGQHCPWITFIVCIKARTVNTPRNDSTESELCNI